MNLTVTKEENTVENKKSYPTSETITLVFKNLVFRDDDSTQTSSYLYYRAYEFDLRYSWHKYTLIKDERLTSFLGYLEDTLSKKIPTKTPKKVILYFSSEKSVCTLRFYTNSNQYKSSSYVDVDLEPLFFSDSDISHGLSMVKFSTDKEPLGEKLEEVGNTEDIIEKEKTSNIEYEPELQQYNKHLDILYDKDVSFCFSAHTLSEKLEDIYQLFGDLLYLNRLDVKKNYFDRYHGK